MISKCALQKQICAYRFALYELALYQDSHPDDPQAMQLRTVYRDRLMQLLNIYEENYGKYVLNHSDVEDSWQEWVQDPWPWDVTKGDGQCVAI